MAIPGVQKSTSLQQILALQDLENGADANNPETFGEGWALESWSYEDALAANQRLARAYNPPAASVQSQWAGSILTQIFEYFRVVFLEWIGFEFEYTYLHLMNLFSTETTIGRFFEPKSLRKAAGWLVDKSNKHAHRLRSAWILPASCSSVINRDKTLEKYVVNLKKARWIT